MMKDIIDCNSCRGTGKINKSVTTQDKRGDWKSEYREIMCTICAGTGQRELARKPGYDLK